MSGRGRGRPRGRGRGRGAASAGAASPGAPIIDQAPDTVATAFKNETPPASQEQIVDISAGASESPYSSHAPADSPQVAMEHSAGPSDPVQLSSRASTISRTGGTTGTKARKPLMFQPRYNKGRRSKEEREAMHKETMDRERERRADSASSAQRGGGAVGAAARSRAGFMGRGDRGGGRGRGGYMGDGGATAAPSNVEGPFSLGSAPKENRKYSQRPRVGSSGGSGKAKDTPIKKEVDVKTENDSGLDTEVGMKQESHEFGYISSDPDENEGPRWNVDEIVNLVSSDDEAASSGPSSRTSSAHPRVKRPKQAPHGLIPVRVSRKQHKDRVMGINTEASSVAVAELRKQQESTGHGSIQDAIVAAAAKSKGKGGTVSGLEAISSRPFKGMWQDDDDLIDITKEAGQEDEEMYDVAVEDAPATEAAAKESQSSPEQKKRSHKAKKPRRKSSASRPRWDAKPAIQTEEEQQEWDRIENDNRLMIAELRHVENDAHADGEASAAEGSESQTQNVLDQKADRVYLFQFPPVIPELFPAPIKVKREESSSPAATLHDAPIRTTETTDSAANASQPVGTINGTTCCPIKIEEGVSSGMPFFSGPSLAPGRAGKLRLHASGRVTLNWGGTNLALQKGMDAKFLQDVVVMKLLPDSEIRVGPNGRTREGMYGGEAMSFGQVRGKFVVVPDFDEIVG